MAFITRSKKLVLSGTRGTVISRPSISPLAWIFSMLPLVLVGLFSGLTLLVFGLVTRERLQFNAYQLELRSVQVSMDVSRPSPGQDDVDIAMAAFGIDVASHVNWPIYDASLADRGLTSGGTLDVRRTIFVGTPAFSSWAVLGSTLGHEIEVHGNQSFMAILALDGASRIGQAARSLSLSQRADASASGGEDEVFWGTLRAERTAYLYEVASAKRYGLRPNEVSSILQVMNAYYSEKPAAK